MITEKKGLSTELRGKSVSSTVYPLSFKEFLEFRNCGHSPASTKGQAEASRLFNDYLTRSKRQEVDFIAVDNRGKPALAVQVGSDLSAPETVERGGRTIGRHRPVLWDPGSHHNHP